MFRNPAPILSKPAVLSLLEDRDGAEVLEIGAGCLRNSLYLQSLGFVVSVVEVKGIEDRFPEQYDTFLRRGGRVFYSVPAHRFNWALGTFVIETICNPTVRNQLIRDVHGSLAHGGFLLLSVRGPKDLITAQAKGVRLSDGYLTPNRTFSRAFSPKQLQILMKSCGFKELHLLHKASTADPELLHAIAYK
jgi:hypothetical protein